MAGREVFADTSALYALVNRNDATHPSACAEVARLLGEGRHLVTTDYVVTETVNLAVARGGPLVAARALELFERTRALRIEWIGSERFARARVFFRKHADQGYSFTDCTSFITMKELNLTDVLTTNRHFRSAKFAVLLPIAR